MNDNTLDGNLGDGMHLTYHPSITEWQHGDVRERLVIPSGESTDYSSIPDHGVLGWLARLLGFDKNAPYFTRSGKIHDTLYFSLKYWGGFLPDGWYQFFNPSTNEWQPMIAFRWDRQTADTIWRRISIEDGCPEAIANRGYRFLRLFGGIHMRFS